MVEQHLIQRLQFSAGSRMMEATKKTNNSYIYYSTQVHQQSLHKRQNKLSLSVRKLCSVSDLSFLIYSVVWNGNDITVLSLDISD